MTGFCGTWNVFKRSKHDNPPCFTRLDNSERYIGACRRLHWSRNKKIFQIQMAKSYRGMSYDARVGCDIVTAVLFI